MLLPGYYGFPLTIFAKFVTSRDKGPWRMTTFVERVCYQGTDVAGIFC